jgi:thiol-disulfide isomerase/thioredoxin
MMNINQLFLGTRHPAAVPLPFEGELPSFSGATAWLNAPPLSAADLRGKVVLVDFWTYTCINWLRTLPYIRAWAEKYQEHGVAAIGVHTPEFPFEHDLENVRRSVTERPPAHRVPLSRPRSASRHGPGGAGNVCAHSRVPRWTGSGCCSRQ